MLIFKIPKPSVLESGRRLPLDSVEGYGSCWGPEPFALGGDGPLIGENPDDGVDM